MFTVLSNAAPPVRMLSQNPLFYETRSVFPRLNECLLSTFRKWVFAQLAYRGKCFCISHKSTPLQGAWAENILTCHLRAKMWPLPLFCICLYTVCRPVTHEECHYNVRGILDWATDAGGQEEGHGLGSHQWGHRRASGQRIVLTVASRPGETGSTGVEPACFSANPTNYLIMSHSIRSCIIF